MGGMSGNEAKMSTSRSMGMAATRGHAVGSTAVGSDAQDGSRRDFFAAREAGGAPRRELISGAAPAPPRGATAAAPFSGGVEVFSAAVAVVAFVALWRYQQDIVKVLAVCAGMGLLRSLSLV